MATTTTMQNWPVPQETDTPDPPRDFLALAQAIEKNVVGIYLSATDRNTRVTAPIEGQVAYLKDSNTFLFYDGSTWTLMFPTQVVITSGTTVPANSSGANGDVFLKV